MSRILADKITNYNNDGPVEAEKGIKIPLNRPLLVAGSPGVSGQYLASTGIGLTWVTAPVAFSGNYNDLTNKPALFSGDYGDLVNTPFVPSFTISNPSPNHYLRYNGSSWVNTAFPTIYQYEIELVDDSPSVTINLNNITQSSVVSSYAIVGSNGVNVTLDDNIITINGPEITPYGSINAIADVGLTLELGSHTGISFDYNSGDGSITATVLSSYTLEGSSDPDVSEDVVISLKDANDTTSGFINLVGDGGVTISWDSDSSTATFNYTNPSPYTLPTASTTNLGGVKVDGSTITIDGNGIITANFIDTGIQYTDLSVVDSTGGGTSTGGLDYDDTNGTFTYTPVETALNDITDVVIGTDVEAGDVIYYTGTGWVSSPLPNVIELGTKLGNLYDVNSADLTESDAGRVLTWSGFLWTYANPMANYVDINFSGYPTPTNSSITYNVGDVILSHDNITSTEVQYICNIGYLKSEIFVCIHAEGGGNIKLQRRVDEEYLGTWTVGTWTDIMEFSTPSTLLAGGPTNLHMIDTHGGGNRDKINYRLVSNSAGLVVIYGKNNQLTAKQVM